eukprot:CAMPEP_0194234634 /NCGR_PEP_ID=MMETSP0158-20130606/2328_1 /TAXON_ID=33649 /ORGANISM="Thalassionema nitzschioides, Strain L26-B" /LENGTH=202 /DNA_ID=CAMNT_0038967891 /DNA_START=384 /DNA_END=987 /DNA_ORIENTATION=+
MNCVIGQYDGYTQEQRAPLDSNTPTYAAVQLSIDNERLEGVPFVLVAGKATLVEIRFQLRNDDDDEVPNKKKKKHECAIIGIQPNGGFRYYYSKSSSSNRRRHRQSIIVRRNEEDNAYATMLGEVLQQQKHNDDASLSSPSFVHPDELVQSWKILTPLLERLEHIQPHRYAKQSAGPKEALRLFPEMMMRTDDDDEFTSIAT